MIMHKTKEYETKTVSEIVREDYRAADVFKKWGINYCCGGNVALTEACAVRNVDKTELVKDLEEATRNISISSSLQFNEWKLDFLVEYITNVHHAYVKQMMPLLEANLLSFVNSHRKQFPELQAVYDTFSALTHTLQHHLKQEEETIFPYIKQMENAFRRKESYGNLFVRTLRKPLSTVDVEDSKTGQLLITIRNLTNQYTFPENACTNHRVVFNKLKEFDNDMMQHKHLENNILFPKAIAMEKSLLETNLAG